MCSYSCGYVSYQLLVASLLPLGISVLFFLPPYVGIFILVLAVLSRFRWSRVRGRVGCRLGQAPREHTTLLKLMQENKKWTIVGSGWDFYQMRSVPPNDTIYMYNFTNATPITQKFNNYKSEQWWRSGTTIGTVAAYYKTINKAFPSLPSIESATIGGWIMSGSHGSSGDVGRPSSFCFEYIHYLDRNKTLQVREYKNFKKKNVLLIVHVSFNLKSFSRNMWLHKRAININPEDPIVGIIEWLKPSYQRALFVGARVMALQWTQQKISNEEEHQDPHCCSRFCLWAQSDPCNAACGCCFENSDAYASKVKLYEVNRFVFPAWRIPLLACAGIGYRNYEIFCLLPSSVLTENNRNVFFVNLVNKLYDAHKTNGGRTELRFGETILFVDVSLRNNFESIFRILEDLGITAYALHEGKFQFKPKNSRMNQVSVETLMQVASQKNLKLRF